MFALYAGNTCLKKKTLLTIVQCAGGAMINFKRKILIIKAVTTG